MDELNRITANEARAYIDGSWKKKLNEIYDGVRAFDNEVKWVLEELARDGYDARIVLPFLADEGITHVIKVKW